MAQRDYRILTGSAGWKHSLWGNEVFYPEDLPTDWYLSFYANEFPIVLVPNKDWFQSSTCDDLVSEIDDQATENFKCVFECRWQANKLIERTQRLEPISDVATTLLLQITSADIAQSQLAKDIESLKDNFHLCLELLDIASENEFTKVKLFCEKHNVSLCWDGVGETIVPESSSVWLARCNSDQDNKQIMQQLKVIIAEQYKNETSTREHIIIIDGAPPKIDVVRNAMVMMELM